MRTYYTLDDFYTIYKEGISFELDPVIYETLNALNKQIIPLFAEKKGDNYSGPSSPYRNSHSGESKSGRSRGGGGGHSSSSYGGSKGKESWNSYSRNGGANNFKPTPVIEKKEEGIEKWIQEIRFCLNKLSDANYEGQKTEIMSCLDKCVRFQGQTEEMCDENVKKIVLSIFHIASTNRFYANLYAKLYKELMEVQPICQDILLSHVNNYTSSVKEIENVDPNDDYEKYCTNNKANEARRSMCVFFVCLMKEKVLPVLRVLNIMVAFQTLVMEYVDIDGKTNEVDEITEILFLFLQEGKDIYAECKAEWIWKFVIKQNIETLSKFTKKDKKSLSSRAIFKYVDMANLIK